MNRNVESHFSLLPQAEISRSKLEISKRHLTSFNTGELIPIYLEEVLPGDTFQVDTSKVLRLQTLVTPMMDNLWLDTYFFFVPSRLCWKHWRELMGENTESAWIPQTEYSVPQLTSPAGGWNVGTIADHFGIPTGVANLSVNALPFRAYSLICNEWFRDENLTDPLVTPDTDSNVVGSNGSNYITDVAKGGQPFKVSKYHDYFTSALPSAQKGQPVSLPLVGSGKWPVYSQSEVHSIYPPDSGFAPIKFKDNNNDDANGNLFVRSGNLRADGTTIADGNPVIPSNLWAYGIDPTVVTINQLRLAFQVQKLLEKDARGGISKCLHVKKIEEKIWKAA